MKQLYSPCVIGGGAFGSAIAFVVALKHGHCKLFVRSKSQEEEINNYHTNRKYINELKLPPTVIASTNYDDIFGFNLIIITVPSVNFMEVVGSLHKIIKGSFDKYNFVIATKGINPEDSKCFSEILKSHFPESNVLILSGPNIAAEILQNEASFINIASLNTEVASNVAVFLGTNNFYATYSNDIIFPQILGCMKNIMGMLAGVLEALNFGSNTKSFLAAVGLKEIISLSMKMGGNIDSINISAITGDFFLSINSQASRNFKFGYNLVKSSNFQEFIDNYPNLVESIHACRAVEPLIKNFSLKLYLTEFSINLISHNKYQPHDLKDALLSLYSNLSGLCTKKAEGEEDKKI